MPEISFDRFYRYDDLTAILRGLADEYPGLLTVDSIGRSHEGRDIWLATVTSAATGPHSEKPALWIDANIHATELTGSAAALYLLQRLVRTYGTDDAVTRALDTRCFYVVPRINPDGAEWAMADVPRLVRSSVRPWPRTDQQDGLALEDIDGDGRILSMRIPDPNGTWKPYADDPRLLVPRDPDEAGEGPYYRLLPEGRIHGWDGVTVKMAPALQGLDLNRNFPVDWRPHGQQAGAGDFPTSEPEIRAVVQAVVDRPNITGYLAYHTQSGVHLRPSSTYADDQLPTTDLRVFKAIGRKATELTGYPAVSVFHDFKYDPKDVVTGVADDWAYEHLGVFSWTTEFWSPLRAAGVTDFKFIEWYIDHPIEDDLKILAFSDDKLGGTGYVDWYPYEHPQLGPVELGGWNSMRFWRNPPLEMLEAEIAPHSDFALHHLLISPRLEMRSAEATAVGEATWRVRLVVENSGWLPTNVTERATERKAVRPLEAEIHLGEGAELASGEPKVELGQLAGRVLKVSMLGGGADPTSDRAKVDWVVRAPAGSSVEVEARHQRAGIVRATVTLGGSLSST